MCLLGSMMIVSSGHAAARPREIAAEAFAARLEPAREQTGGTAIEFEPCTARFVRLFIYRSSGSQPCLDELEVYGPDSPDNLALATRGAKAKASSTLAGYAIHAVPHLNDGLYGNGHSWISAGDKNEWAQIELPAAARVSRVVISRDRERRFTDRQVLHADVQVSSDGLNWQTVATLKRNAGQLRAPATLTFPANDLPEPTWNGLVTYAFLRERDLWSRMDANDYLSPLRNDRPAVPDGPPYWGRLVRLNPLERALVQFEDLVERVARRGLDVSAERRELDELRRQVEADPAAGSSDALYLAARAAKRRLFFRDPLLAPLERVLFSKRHPLKPSHNYSEHFDSLFAPGGGVCVLHVPRDAEGRLDPAHAELEQLFDGSDGIVRHPMADFDARTVYFAFRPDTPKVEGWQSYWHLMSVRTDGSGLRQLTEGPYHDFDPVALPDGGVAFMSTRCEERFLCWRPQAYVLYRMEPDGSGMRRLSFSNLSEWDPAIMRDGRILWTRSEYLDKGADFGHTLWAIRPDGTHPELVFGNDTPYGYGHARDVPGSRELVCTIISHGDHQGPIALLDPDKGRFNTAAITSLTPETRPQYQMDRSHIESFRDPCPVSHDHFVVSHNPGRRDHWCLYVIDRYGNRELLYADPAISSMKPSPLHARPHPPVFPDACDPQLAARDLGQFTVQDVYAGLNGVVPRGRAKYIEVSQEMPAKLEKLPSGEYCSDHPAFQDFYATPIHLVHGPAHSYTTRTANAVQPHAFRAGQASAKGDETFVVTERNGWPSYVAKAVLGTAPIAEDGSANFTAPAGEVLYFHLLDENYNELQRMRSVVQLQPGERRSCVGCHETRLSTPRPHPGTALLAAPQPLEPPPWGAVTFDYGEHVQPVLDARCGRCHAEGAARKKLDLSAERDAYGIPASYRSLIAGGWVHYFDMVYGARHFKAEPLSFGTLQSRLFDVLKAKQHDEVKLTNDELRALKAWVDLNCPLWPDYQYRPDRIRSGSSVDRAARAGGGGHPRGDATVVADAKR